MGYRHLRVSCSCRCRAGSSSPSNSALPRGGGAALCCSGTASRVRSHRPSQECHRTGRLP
ncbi:hypothetical protein APY03_2208 [Variovorax sp. WDL1]|nr:hypothetical protein APY03_2208 [Variovorax sp. WDL1]